MRVVVNAREMFVADQGDGWWDCRSPLRCMIVDGPGISQTLDARWVDGDSSLYWLVTTEPEIVWNSNSRYADEFGVDDPRGHPLITNRALVMARGVKVVNLDRAFSVPIYPVVRGAQSLVDAEPLVVMGVKATVYRGDAPPGVRRDRP